MSAKAGDLLDIMKVRLGMQRDGITDPPPPVKAATQALVEKLSVIDPEETIHVHIERDRPLLVKYIRASTGELLAELHERAAT